MANGYAVLKNHDKVLEYAFRADSIAKNSKNFTDSIEYRARDLGRLIGVEHAEGFTSERYVAVKNLDKLI